MREIKKRFLCSGILLFLLLFLMIFGLAIDEANYAVSFSNSYLPPSTSHFFGTDWLGRDLFYRTIKGVSFSLAFGLLTAIVSTIIGFLMGVTAGLSPKWLDQILLFVIDLVLSVPHFIVLILISFSVGGGAKGVFFGMICTHWTSFARLMRAEVLKIKEEPYIKISKKFGRSNFFLMTQHILPHVLPQAVVGVVVMLPHVILHESAITFLGFGFSPEAPAIGIILAEAMKTVGTPYWWSILSGVVLVVVVILVDGLGNLLKK